jgi:hypothetical protein
MSLRYISGSSYDARAEVEDLLRRLSSGPLLAIIDMLRSLRVGERDGFHTVSYKWSRSGYVELFSYVAYDLIAAINVPGDGRGTTRDLTLLGVRHYPLGISSERTTFEAEMGIRRSGGVEHVWT